MSWKSDYAERVIATFADSNDISAVNFGASPTRSIAVEDLADQLEPVGGDDGNQGGGGGNAPGVGSEDGTGSRARSIVRMIDLDRDRLRLRWARFGMK
jgi:hypothetical protein